MLHFALLSFFFFCGQFSGSLELDGNETGVLVVLDARPDGIIYQDLIPEYVQFARTLYEGFFSSVFTLI